MFKYIIYINTVRCVKTANFNLIEKKTYFAELLSYLMKHSWRNTTKWYLTKKKPSIKAIELLELIFSYTCDFPRIIVFNIIYQFLFFHLPPISKMPKCTSSLRTSRYDTECYQIEHISEFLRSIFTTFDSIFVNNNGPNNDEISILVLKTSKYFTLNECLEFVMRDMFYLKTTIKK